MKDDAILYHGIRLPNKINHDIAILTLAHKQPLCVTQKAPVLHLKLLKSTQIDKIS